MTRPLHLGYVLAFSTLSETFILHELLALERLGHQVTVFALGRPDEPTTHPALAQLRAEVLYVPKAPKEAQAHLAMPSRQHWQASWVADQARARGVAHLHAHFATGATVLAREVRHLTGIPYSFTAHAKDIYHEAVDFNTVRAAILDSAFTVTVSDHNVAHLVEACGRDVAPRLRRRRQRHRPRPVRVRGPGGPTAIARPRRRALVGRRASATIDAVALLRQEGRPHHPRRHREEDAAFAHGSPSETARRRDADGRAARTRSSR
jgi:hypothetical protein